MSQNLWLESEVFCGHAAGVLSSGSTRHALVGPWLVKGVGANELCHRTDFDHAWGGLWMQDGLSEYTQSALLLSLLPEGVVRSTLMTIPCEPDGNLMEIDGCHLSQLWRDFSTIRLSQLDHDYLFESEFETVKKFLQQKFPNGAREAWERICFQYASALFFGIRQRSNIKENFTITAELIDLNSVKVCDTDDFSVYLYFSALNDTGLPEAEVIKQALHDPQKQVRLIDTDLASNLYLGCLGTLNCLKRFLPDIPDERETIAFFHNLVARLVEKMGGDASFYRQSIPALTEYALAYLRNGGASGNYFFAYVENIVLGLAPDFNRQSSFFRQNCSSLLLQKELIHLDSICFHGRLTMSPLSAPQNRVDKFILAFNHRKDRIRHNEISENVLLWAEHIEIDDPIDRSSRLHQYLLRNSRLNPYIIRDQEIVHRFWSLEEIVEEIQEHCLFGPIEKYEFYFWQETGFASVSSNSLEGGYEQLPELCVLIHVGLKIDGRSLVPLLPLKLIKR